MAATHVDALGIQIPGSKDMHTTEITEFSHPHTPTEEKAFNPQSDTPRVTRRVSDQERTSPGAVSPLSVDDDDTYSRGSMSSIALTDTSLDYDRSSQHNIDDVLATPRVSGIRHLRKPSSLEIIQTSWGPPSRQSTLFDVSKDSPLPTPVSGWADDEMEDERRGAWFNATSASPRASKVSSPRSLSACSSEDTHEVDWSQLDRNEEQEKVDKDIPKGAEDESTAFLLARLEQENAKFQDVKTAIPQRVRSRKGSRPPSMSHLKKLVQNRDTMSHRFSVAVETAVPDEPPPMTELEFWAALVKDYPSTASRLPTLTTTKIRGGIPPPLRGVVWTSMAGARDSTLEESYDKLLGEKSPYEGIINKDVGRSFPGVELFREADGEGQKMLGRVLKCFSLHDKDIGYCQGLGFLVGPLLMNMAEKEAFCVLVRLMDHYSLRPSFLPSLSGLHMRIYQFSSLMKEHNKDLSEHLAELGIEPAYLSQWFLSCFAVTCPLALLFRIYDVIFAEGANETVMRVALALMRRNEQKMLECGEFEEVMQLLLGRGIWDSYGCNPDEMVDDFTSLGNIITHAKLAELEKEFDNQSREVVGQSAGFLPDVQAAASRFLGRLWAPSHASTPSKSTTLAPNSAEKETTSSTPGFLHSRTPSFFLRRTPSKQSIGTVNDSSGSETTQSSGSASTAPTEADDVAPRGSVADTLSLNSKADSHLAPSGGATPSLKEQQDLHFQIEDLLMALSEMQRDHSQMAAILQKEREDRSEDHRTMRRLIVQLRGSTKHQEQDELTVLKNKRRTMPPPKPSKESHQRSKSFQNGTNKKSNELEALLDDVEERLVKNSRLSASFETKAQLRSTLTRTREQLVVAEEHAKDLASRLESAEAFQQEADELRTEVSELRSRVSEEFKNRQKLEHSLRETKAQARAMERKSRGQILRAESASEVPTLSKTETSKRDSVTANSSSSVSSGLRELKLGRPDSISSIHSIRSQNRLSLSPGSDNSNRRASITPINTGASPADMGNATDSSADVPDTPASVTSPQMFSSFAPRTSSLATKDSNAPSESQETLLMELVNAKTAEAEAKQEIDVMKKALNQEKRKHEHALQALQDQVEAAKEEAKKAAELAEAARAEAAATLLNTTSLSDANYDSDARDLNSTIPTPVTPVAENRKTAPTPPATTGGGWFWSRRTASTTKVPTMSDGKKA